MICFILALVPGCRRVNRTQVSSLSEIGAQKDDPVLSTLGWSSLSMLAQYVSEVDLPTPFGAVMLDGDESLTQSGNFYLQYTVQDDPSNVMNFYCNEMERLGWLLCAQPAQYKKKGWVLLFEKPKNQIILMINPVRSQETETTQTSVYCMDRINHS